MKLNRFAWFAWGVLGYNILVILWGALVRATGSGAGCGRHWPTCHGELLPLASQTASLIEFAHRITSGLALFAIFALFIWTYRRYPKGHIVRFGANISITFIIIEALLGAGLVLFELVGDDSSTTRGIVVGVHLINTYLLLGCLTLTAWWASGGKVVQLKGQGWLGLALIIGFIGLLLLGASGAIIALGDTLFPATSLAEGLKQKSLPTAHFFVKLRPYHPMIAIIIGIYLISITKILNAVRPTLTTRYIAKIVTVVYLIQLVAGAFTVVLLAPIWMQLLHLMLSDLILVAWVLFMAAAFAKDSPYLSSKQVVNASSPHIYSSQ